MKHFLHNFLFIITLFFSINSFAGTKFSDDVVCPTASISYSSMTYCNSDPNQAVNLTGTDAYLGGVFMSTSGLTINTSTGAITPSTSAPGVYTITYTIPSGPGCPSSSTYTTVTILPGNTASIASSTQTVCVNTPITTITHSTTGATGIGVSTGLPAGVTASWAANTITIAGIPMIAGVFNYTIPLTGGCGTTVATGTIIVSPNNTVSMASFYPTLCINTPISPIITHSTTGATGIGIPIGLPQGLVANWSSNTLTISGAPTVAGSFNYAIPLTGGCGTTYATGTITVLSGPGNTTISGSTTTCAGTPVNLTITATPGTVVSMSNGGAPVSYTIGASGSHVISVSPTVTTTYTLTNANLYGCGSPVFNQSATVTVSSNPEFITQIPDITICNGELLNIASQLTSTVPGTNYYWTAATSNVNSITTSGDQNNIDQVLNLINTSQNGIILLNVTPHLGSCLGTSQQIVVNVKPIPVIASITANNTSICNNEFVTITANSISNVTSYNWQVSTATGVQIFGGATSGTSTTNTINLQLSLLNNSVSGTIKFNITPVNGNCIGATVVNAVTIIVNPLPGTPIALPANEICSGENTNLIIATLPNLAGTTIEWTVTDSQNVTGFTNGSGAFPFIINDLLINNFSTQGFVKYSVTTKLGNCYGGTTDYIVYVNPALNPILSDGNICLDPITGMATQGYILDTQLSNPNYTYDWFLQNTSTLIYDQIVGANASTYEAMVAGNYQVIVANSITNCNSIATASVLETFPATEITATVSDDSTVTVNVNATGTGNLIYALDSGAWQNSNIFTGVQAGIHTFLVSDLEGCTNLSIQVTVNETVVDLVTFPNPISDTLNFKNKSKVLSIQICNQLGQNVLLKEINQKNGTIDLSGLNTGLYSIIFETENGVVNQRILKN